jgi:hypothetical protein
MNLEWTGYYIPFEKDSSIPNMEEFNWYNQEMRDPFHGVVEEIRRSTHKRERKPLEKWQVNQIVKNNDFDNFYDFVKLIEKEHGIVERNEDAN